MAEAATAPGGMLRTLVGALPGSRRRQLVLLTLLTLAGAAAEQLLVGSALVFLSALADRPLPAGFAAFMPFGGLAATVTAAALTFAGCVILANGLRLLNLWATEAYVAAVAHELTVETQRRVLAQPFEYHARHHSSELIASLEKVQLLSSTFIQQWLQSVAAIASGLAIMALIASIDPLPALIALVGLGIMYLAIARVAAARLKANSEVFGQAFGERIRKVQESAGAIRDVKIDQSERAQLEDFRKSDARYAASRVTIGFTISAPRYVVESGAVLLVALLAAMLAARGQGDGILLLIAGLAIGGMRLLPLLQTAYRNWATAKGHLALIADVMELLSLPLPPGEDEDGPAMAFHQGVRLDAVSYQYAERQTPAVDGVSLEIRRGSRLALAGETGSGKSTLADLIMGLLRPSMGTISVDGESLTQANVRGWQRNIAHVSQNTFLADASIARNIAFSVPSEAADPARVREAARIAELLDFIESLPQGFETAVGERGVRLSGGQRQRIGIARAIYKDAPLLVLDEATNALDEQTEARVLANIFADKGRTVLMIAHRAAAIALCDEVVRLENGRIAGQAPAS